MQSVKNNFSQFMSKTITTGIGMLFSLSYLRNPKRGVKVNAPKDFSPVLRFAVCSDIHLNGENGQEAALRFEKLFDDSYHYAANDSEYKHLDAVVVAGDFTGGGDEKEYRIFNDIVKRKIKDETKLLTVLGNHEFIKYRDTDATVGYDIYKKHISARVDTHTVINGFHFIGVSYDDDGKNFTKKLEWLKAQLNEAKNADPAKPIFVYQHPHPFATVYGSINWGSFELRKILQKYPQVVDFSGHSHYAPSDPRSVWQGSFTAVGCGSLAAFMGNLNYIEGDKDAPGRTGGFWVAEVDRDGNIMLRLYDIEKRRFFDECEYYFSDIADKKKRAYTWSKQKSLDTPPLFEKKPLVATEVSDDGNVKLRFPEAKGYYPAENYKITIRSADNKIVWSKTVISGYVSIENKDMCIDLGILEKGEYKLHITAYSPYAKRGAFFKENILV